MKGKNEPSLYELALRIWIKLIAKSNLNKTRLENNLENFTKELSATTTMNGNTKIYTHYVRMLLILLIKPSKYGII